MSKRPKIEYACGCLIHVNGPADCGGLSLSMCRHYCKRHLAKIRAMEEFIRTKGKVSK